MTMDTLFQGADPSDTRFQFEIIKGLAESIRQLTTGVADMQRTQVGMLERLAKLEANRVGEIVAEMKADVAKLEATVSALNVEKNQRDGAYGVFSWLRVWGPVIFSLFAALWLFGRSIGVVPAPPVAPTRVEATIHPEERKIEGTVGGKP